MKTSQDYIAFKQLMQYEDKKFGNPSIFWGFSPQDIWSSGLKPAVSP